MISSSERAAERRGSAALAAVIGHELNNVAVPLEGFAELALQAMTAAEPARQSMDEIRIAIGRIKALAAELEMLGESHSAPERIGIGGCMPDAASSESWEITWLCAASTLVSADALHAQHAILALARLAGPSGGTPSPPQLTVSQEPHGAARCAACDAPVTTRRKWVQVAAHTVRALSQEALRDPFCAPRLGSASRRINLAALLHCAHCAGGHVLLEAASGRLSIAFTAA